MRLRRAIIPLLLIMAVYVAALVWIDARNDVFSFLPWLGATMPVLACAALLSIILRYLRWQWLIKRTGHSVPGMHGLLAYISGFAFTASPGKAGELVRIRYHTPLGVPPSRVFAAFVYERVFDLICVLTLASLAIGLSPLFLVALSFSAIALVAVTTFVLRPQWLKSMMNILPVRLLTIATPLASTIRDGFAGIRNWLTWKDCIMSFMIGLFAWGTLSVAFCWMLASLGIEVPPRASLAIYPLSMLVGAASMIPGGLGSTEAAITALLAGFSADVALAASAAITIRLATLWLAIAIGVLSILYLEIRRASP